MKTHLLLLAVVLCATAFAQTQPYPAAPAAAADTGVYQVGYAANLNVGDSFVNITNNGALSGNDPAGRICANIYVFDPNEEPVSCCACPITPNGLVSISARNGLIANHLTPGVPTSIVVKILYSQSSSCNAQTPTAANLVRGGIAWGTTLHANTSTSPATYQQTDARFTNSELSGSELTKLTSICAFIQTYASGFGICRGCSAGAQGAYAAN